MCKLWVWTVSHCLAAPIQTKCCFSHCSRAGTSAQIGSSSPGSQWEVNEEQNNRKGKTKTTGYSQKRTL